MLTFPGMTREPESAADAQRQEGRAQVIVHHHWMATSLKYVGSVFGSLLLVALALPVCFVLYALLNQLLGL